MSKVFIINAHQPSPFSAGTLNRSLVERLERHCAEAGHETLLTVMQEDAMEEEIDVDREIERHHWADVVFLQSPVNWMGVPWSFKRYMDLVYTAGMDGRLCAGDGRSRQDPRAQYGSGGTLGGTRYALSLTFNAPRGAFDDPSQTFFGGGSVDDLFWPTHLNFEFFGMERLETFSCHDVMKNPEVERDFERFDAYLARILPRVDAGVSQPVGVR
ncbi:MAG: NAD(P)H-dependent oxidoreductase [Acidobacteriota bacterium]